MDVKRLVGRERGVEAVDFGMQGAWRGMRVQRRAIEGDCRYRSRCRSRSSGEQIAIFHSLQTQIPLHTTQSRTQPPVTGTQLR